MRACVVAALLSAANMPAGSWKDLPPLPSAISGQAAGVSHGALLVIGGSSFEKPPYDGGVKQWHDTILILEPNASHWITFHTRRAFGYGGSVTWKESVIVAGGTDGRENFNEVREFQWRSGKPAEAELPSLPMPLANCAAALIGDRLFVFGGQESPSATSASKRLFSLDLAHRSEGWKSLEQLPGPGRILPVFAAVGQELYVFGGAELTPAGRNYLHDGWRWSAAAHGWKPAPAPPFSMVAAPVISASPDRIIAFGGDDGAMVNRVEELRERHPGFSKQINVFETGKQKWTQAGALPLGLVTTAAVAWGGRSVIPGGEDRPGHRSSRVLGWLPE